MFVFNTPCIKDTDTVHRLSDYRFPIILSTVYTVTAFFSRCEARSMIFDMVLPCTLRVTVEIFRMALPRMYIVNLNNNIGFRFEFPGTLKDPCLCCNTFPLSQGRFQSEIKRVMGVFPFVILSYLKQRICTQR